GQAVRFHFGDQCTFGLLRITELLGFLTGHVRDLCANLVEVDHAGVGSIGCRAERFRLFLDRELEHLASAVAENGNFNLFAGGQPGDNALEALGIRDGLAPNLGQHVAILESSLGSGCARSHLGDYDAALVLQAEFGRNLWIESLHLYAEIAAMDFSAMLKLLHDVLGQVARNSQSDSLEAAGP